MLLGGGGLDHGTRSVDKIVDVLRRETLHLESKRSVLAVAVTVEDPLELESFLGVGNLPLHALAEGMVSLRSSHVAVWEDLGLLLLGRDHADRVVDEELHQLFVAVPVFDALLPGRRELRPRVSWLEVPREDDFLKRDGRS